MEGRGSGLDLLPGARVQVGEFRQPLAAEMVAESLERTRFCGASGTLHQGAKARVSSGEWSVARVFR